MWQEYNGSDSCHCLKLSPQHIHTVELVESHFRILWARSIYRLESSRFIVYLSFELVGLDQLAFEQTLLVHRLALATLVLLILASTTF